MRIATIPVPIALLLSRELTPAAKALWIALRLDEARERKRSHSPAHLARRTGLARSTIYEALASLTRTGWCVERRRRARQKRRINTVLRCGAASRRVQLPAQLAASLRPLRPQALVCFGLLQATEGYAEGRGSFKWAQLSRATGLDTRTLKRAVSELVTAGWLTIRQKNRLAPLVFVLHHPDAAWRRAAERRLQKHPHTGQALMQEFLNLIVDSFEFVEDGSAGFLVNPRTQHLMQFDRFYPVHRVAFEFNGRQHYEETEIFSKEQVAAQRARDKAKRAICAAKGITLVVVHAEDLSLEGMRRKVPDTLPKRDLRGFSGTIRHLESVARRYRRAAARHGSLKATRSRPLGPLRPSDVRTQ